MPYKIYSAKRSFYVAKKGEKTFSKEQPISSKTAEIHKYNEGKKVASLYSNGKN